MSITTATAAFGLIDFGATSPYNMVQVGNAQIAPGAVTTTKIATGAVTSTDVAPSFIRSRILADGQNGWNPNDGSIFFIIADATINANSHIFTSNDDALGPAVLCAEQGLTPGGGFNLSCDNPPEEGTVLRYTIIDQPNI